MTHLKGEPTKGYSCFIGKDKRGHEYKQGLVFNYGTLDGLMEAIGKISENLKAEKYKLDEYQGKPSPAYRGRIRFENPIF